MDLLKRKLTGNGAAAGTELIKVDSFLNQQLDIGLFMAIGKELYSRFGHLGINKILTMEASGIAIAAITSMYFDLAPVVFAKKSRPDRMTGECYTAEVKSFTENIVYTAQIDKSCLNENDRLLIVDDFLASGETAMGLCTLAKQAGAVVCAITGIIEKEFLGGSRKLREAGYHVDSLAVITKIENGTIYFKEN